MRWMGCSNKTILRAMTRLRCRPEAKAVAAQAERATIAAKLKRAQQVNQGHQAAAALRKLFGF